jgi:hypothetical protein
VKRDPSLSPADAVMLAKAAAEEGRWRAQAPEEMAARAFGEVKGGFAPAHFRETEAAVFELGDS